MNSEIPNADLIRALLSGKTGQAKNLRGEWVDCTPADFVAFCANWPDGDERLRIKPDERPMIRVNGVLVPKHEVVAPEVDKNYCLPTIHRTGSSGWTPWKGDCDDKKWLAAGLVYLNAEDARARAKAMLKWEEVS